MQVVLTTNNRSKFAHKHSILSDTTAIWKGFITERRMDSGILMTFDLRKVIDYYSGKDIKVTYDTIKKQMNEFLALVSTHPSQELKTPPSDRDIHSAIAQIREKQREAKTIHLQQDLSVRSSFRGEIITRASSAWDMRKTKNGWHGKLLDPLKVQNDISHWQASGFLIKASGTSLQRLSLEVKKEEKESQTAYILSTNSGYTLDYASRLLKLTDQLISKLNNVLKKPLANIAPTRNCRTRVDLDFFTLPYVCSLLRGFGVKEIIGTELVYPDVKPFCENVEKFYELNAHQEEAYRAWSRDGIGTITLPTGGRKTMVAIEAIANDRLPTMVVVPTIELVHQWKEEILKFTDIPEESIGIFCAEKKEIAPITIITYQSGHRAIDEDLPIEDPEFLDEYTNLSDQFGMIVFDEGHHAPASVFRRIMMNAKSPKRMNLTATAKREDGKEALSFIACGPVIYTKSYAELAKQKIVSPMRYKQVRTPLNEIETEIVYWLAKLRGDFVLETNRLRMSEQEESEAWSKLKTKKKLARSKLVELFKETAYGETEASIKNNIFEDKDSTHGIELRKIFGFARSKFNKLLDILQAHSGENILIFNEFRQGARMISEYVNQNGFKSNVLIGGQNDRQQIFSDFVEKKKRILITTTVLDQGVNVPDCSVVVVFNGSRSQKQMIQRAGRGSRYLPGKIETIYELVGIVDTSMYQPQFQDCKKFSDFSTYELSVSEERDLSSVIDFEAMEKIIHQIENAQS